MKRTLFLFLSIGVSMLSAAQQRAMKLWYDKPATFFEESLPIGNGKMGALIYGHPDDDVLHLNDITFWTGKPVDRNEGSGAAEWIPKIREALFHEDYAKADSLQLHVQGHNSEFYQPLATVHILDDNHRAIGSYYRELDLDSSLVKIIYQRDHVIYSREYFASNPDKLIAVRLTADKPGALNFHVKMTAQVPHQVKAANGNQLTMTGHATGNPQESIHFCSILTAKTDGKQTAADSTLYINDATEAVLYFVNETSFNGFDKHPVTEGADYLGAVTDDIWHTQNYTYAQFRDRHVKDYKQFFDRVKLRLGKMEQHIVASKAFPVYEDYESEIVPTDQLLKNYTLVQEQSPAPSLSSSQKPAAELYLETLYFQYGRYLLISCSRTPGVPANLQGLWTPHLWSPWRGNYTMNINLEENYWPAETTNLSEMTEPLNGFVSALAENGKYTAFNFYGVENGWCASHNSDIWAMTNPVGEEHESPMWANWNMGGAWLVNALWEHYQFTKDEEYLRHTAYPLMKGAADFCLNWLIRNPKNDSELITAPSTSPENEYVTDTGYHGVTCYGGTADLAIIRELLMNTYQAQLITGHTQGGTSRLLDTYLSLRPYQIGHMGDLNEWYYDWDDKDFKHRHQSHLIGLYPGNDLLTFSSEAGVQAYSREKLLQACRRSLEIKGDETTGWSTGWRINLWARLRDGEKAHEIYRKLLTYVSPENYQGADKRHGGGTYSNLFDAHPPFQIDGNFGGTAGVCEMLLQSQLAPSAPSRSPAGPQLATISLLPALPRAWKDGEVKGLCARGGFVVDMRWEDGKVVEATVYSRAGGQVALCYNGKTKQLKLKKGQSKRIRG
ncbi:MAG: glycoside hydrolase family 95 protein [Prevotella sp.]|nr:glycoside hydrolase family 95 protein [Prevotella sp.]